MARHRQSQMRHEKHESSQHGDQNKDRRIARILFSKLTNLLFFVVMVGLAAQMPLSASTSTEYDIYVTCTSTGQLCSPAYSATFNVAQPSTVSIEYTTAPTHCSSIRVFAYVDSALVATSAFLGPDQSTGQISLGTLSTANHVVELQAEGELGGCNVGNPRSWAGTLVITQTTKLTITTTSIPSGIFISPYSVDLKADGGQLPYTWTLSALSLPAGLSITPSGLIEGSFAPDAEAGPNFDRVKRSFDSFNVTVTDSQGHKDHKSLQIMKFTCGDDRDTLIQQYFDFRGGLGVAGGFIPRCMDMTSGSSLDTYTSNYNFAELNTSNLSVPDEALLSVFMLLDLDMIVQNYGSIPRNGPRCSASGKGGTCLVNSGFRPPEDQQRVYDKINADNAAKALKNHQPPPKLVKTPSGGRHMFGDAVDLPNNPLTKDNFYALTNAVVNAGADITEMNMGSQFSCSKEKYMCVHADWRYSTSSYAK